MKFDEQLTGKLLDPIHGVIRLSELEVKVIDSPLFQRLRKIKQNTFLFKVFPSAMHSRFEHSIGAMHLSYEIIKSLKANTYRFSKKYGDDFQCLDIGLIDCKHIQELRLAALLHDVGHGPLSHEFDSFMCEKEYLEKHIGDEFGNLFKIIDKGSKLEHEQFSIIFSILILKEIDELGDVEIHNIIKIMESNYSDKKMSIFQSNKKIDILPLLSSIISSCPIDADRMDYLLRDSYFSGVNCGVYDYERLFMSIIPIINGSQAFLAYKESGLDSILEFINRRSSLFGQVYFHKTNRAFSAMLSKACDLARVQKNDEKLNIFEGIEGCSNEKEKITFLEDFYVENYDNHFLEKRLKDHIGNSSNREIGCDLLDGIIERKSWKKIFEQKVVNSTVSISYNKDSNEVKDLKGEMTDYLNQKLGENEFIVDVAIDISFKDVSKSTVKLLIKSLGGKYEIKKLAQCGDRLNDYQKIKYYIRVFSKEKILNKEMEAKLLKIVEKAEL